MDKRTQTQQSTSDLIEEQLVAFAEQLGGLVGTVQTRAEGWLDRSALTKEIGRIRESAADLLAHMNRDTLQSNTPAEPTPPATRRSRGPVDAPGKRHRKPPPRERIDRQQREPRGKQMGQKNIKSGRRRGRG